MKTIIIILLQLHVIFAYSQVKISGAAQTTGGQPVAGANIVLNGTYDGCSSDSLGNFAFTTSETGSQQLAASFVGFQTCVTSLQISDTDIHGIRFVLVEVNDELDEVVINAGSFEASDKKKSVILKPLDIALTAGANGDIFGAFATLPGSHTVGEEGRLFVRGGESYETKTFMDGMLVQTPYFSKSPDLPTRGRFSPLLFNGMVFSTGGYSAEFGQALSSVVALNTVALEEKDQASISAMTVGVTGSRSKRWQNSSLAFTGEFLHTGLSNKIFRQNIDWVNTPVIIGTTLLYRHKTSETGMLKTYGSINMNSSRMIYNNFSEASFQDISLGNMNSYVNTTYNEMAGENWMVCSGAALNFDRENVHLNKNQILTSKKTGQVKLSVASTASEKIKTKLGAEYLFYNYQQEIFMPGLFILNFNNHLVSGFAESEVKAGKRLAFKAGVRGEYNSVIPQFGVVPRLSAALKTGKNSQVSAAYGCFFQNPEDDYLKFSESLTAEKSSHSILTYQFKKDTRTLRIEAYYKNYSNLVKFEDPYSGAPGNFTNTGSGYSRGIDVFWRNQKPFGKSDYWISYSWNDSKRNYQNFSTRVTPHYISAHNVSVVYKKFFTKINCFGSVTYTFASGRPYFNPNNPNFMTDRTKTYNDFSLGLTHILYVLNKQTVLHLIVNNALGFNNVFGYQYAKTPDSSGIYDSKPITPASRRMIVALISFQL